MHRNKKKKISPLTTLKKIFCYLFILFFFSFRAKQTASSMVDLTEEQSSHEMMADDSDYQLALLLDKQEKEKFRKAKSETFKGIILY